MFIEIIFTSKKSIKNIYKDRNYENCMINNYTYYYVYEKKQFNKFNYAEYLYFDNFKSLFLTNDLYKVACVLVIFDTKYKSNRKIIITDDFLYAYLYSKYGIYNCNNKKEYKFINYKKDEEDCDCKLSEKELNKKINWHNLKCFEKELHKLHFEIYKLCFTEEYSYDYNDVSYDCSCKSKLCLSTLVSKNNIDKIYVNHVYYFFVVMI